MLGRNLLISTLSACVLPLTVNAQNEDPSLMDIARVHVGIAESTREDAQLWGRIGGSAAERDSAHQLMRQLHGTYHRADVEPVEYYAYRPQHWTLEIDGAPGLESAMPAPFDAWMPDIEATPIVQVRSDSDWARVRGAVAFLEATTDGSAARTNVRAQKLYQRAVDSGALGFVFSLPTPAGLWRSVVPVDKPFATADTFFPNHRRPIPCFSVDSEDGARLREAAASGSTLSIDIEFDPSRQRKGLNVVGAVDGTGSDWVMLACHLDSFFGGANDDASGIAVLVGLSRRIARLPLSARLANFWFVGLSGHHDEGAGMRAFSQTDPKRMEGIKTAILLEHLDMHFGDDAPESAIEAPLTDLRAAYVGPSGWPEIEPVLGKLVMDSGLMSGPPRVVRECIADLFVICDEVQPFSLMAAPPFYHTDHDTMDKLTEDGLQRAVEFHLLLLDAAGYIDLDAAADQSDNI